VLKAEVDPYLAHVGFSKNWDLFLGGGVPPVVAPEGDLVFWGKLSCPFY
jgi:hypothetical protein